MMDGQSDIGFQDTRMTFTYYPEPIVTSFYPLRISEGGGGRGRSWGENENANTITILGENFVNLSTMACQIGHAPLSPVRWVSSTHVECPVPTRLLAPGFYTVALLPNGQDAITLDQKESCSLELEIVAAMTILSCAPALGPTSGNTRVTLVGNPSLVKHVQQQRGADDVLLVCWFGGAATRALITVADDESSSSSSVPTKIVCPSPPRLGLKAGTVNLTVEVLTTKRRLFAGVFHYYSPPKAMNISPSMGPATGGTVVKIMLSSSSDPSLDNLPPPYCRFGRGKKAIYQPALRLYPSTLSCTTPPAAATAAMAVTR
jgi:hypothetical protein